MIIHDSICNSICEKHSLLKLLKMDQAVKRKRERPQRGSVDVVKEYMHRVGVSTHLTTL